MTVEAFRIQNFMGFADSGWIELRPITLLFGRNSAGKSAILRALLLLKQSLDNPPEFGPLLFVKDDGLDFGDYTELVRDHNSKQDISFWFTCRFSQEDDDLYSGRGLYALNQLTVSAQDRVMEPPSSGQIIVRLIYGLNRAGRPTLRAVDLYDAQRDVILSASSSDGERDSEQTWLFESQFFDLANQPEPNLWPYMDMFTKAGFLPWIRPHESQLAQADEDEPNKEDFGHPFNLTWLLLRGIRSSITTFLQGLRYLEPLRAEPQRFYHVPGHSTNLGQRGQHIVRTLLQHGQAPLRQVNQWLATSGFKVQLQLHKLDSRSTLYELRLAEMENRADNSVFSANIREVGFGLTQVLPIIVQAILSPSNVTMMIEQPELHLHPRAQAELGDIFISAAHHGAYSLLETHSEHLLLRLQTQIAKTTAGQISMEQSNRMLLPDQVGIYFAHRMRGSSTLTRIDIGLYGDLLNTPDGFEDFFSDDMLETAERMRARLGHRKGPS